MKVVVIDDEALDKWTHFFGSQPPAFQLELDNQTGVSSEGISTSRFRNCVRARLELRNGTARPNGPNSMHYYLKTIAEPDAPPNGGPAEPLGHPGAGGGPPSVSRAFAAAILG